MPAAVDPAIDEEEAPSIRPSLPEPEVDDDYFDEDIIEGLEYLDPIPSIDISLRLDLSLVDVLRPLPRQAGKVLSDTLGSLFIACSIGLFESSGAEWRKDKDGQQIHTRVSFSIGIKGDPEPPVQLIREALWWAGAPADTDLDGFPLALTREPATAAGRFLQLAAPEIARWRLDGEDGHRIDRVTFTKAQRDGIRRILTEAQAAEAANGWVSVATRDGGRLAVSIKYLDVAPDYDTLNILVDVLTPEISGLVYRLMLECDLMSWPMAFAASTEVARAIDCGWPEVDVVASAAELHRLLSRGPYHWWSRASHSPS